MELFCYRNVHVLSLNESEEKAAALQRSINPSGTDVQPHACLSYDLHGSPASPQPLMIPSQFLMPSPGTELAQARVLSWFHSTVHQQCHGFRG